MHRQRFDVETMEKAKEAGPPPSQTTAAPGESAEAYRKRQDEWLTAFVPGAVLSQEPSLRRQEWKKYVEKHRRAVQAAARREGDVVDLRPPWRPLKKKRGRPGDRPDEVEQAEAYITVPIPTPIPKLSR